MIKEYQGKRERRGIPLTGGSSLLVIFSVLCLTVFAMLTLSTVRADIRIADASIRSIGEYYQADCAAEEILARLRRGEMPEGVVREGNIYAYSCELSDTQALSVVVELTDGEYQIHQWKAVVTAEWSPEEYIQVWIPEEEEE